MGASLRGLSGNFIWLSGTGDFRGLSGNIRGLKDDGGGVASRVFIAGVGPSMNGAAAVEISE